jgi:hypothetical protein
MSSGANGRARNEEDWLANGKTGRLRKRYFLLKTRSRGIWKMASTILAEVNFLGSPRVAFGASYSASLWKLDGGCVAQAADVAGLEGLIGPGDRKSVQPMAIRAPGIGYAPLKKLAGAIKARLSHDGGNGDFGWLSVCD